MDEKGKRAIEIAFWNVAGLETRIWSFGKRSHDEMLFIGDVVEEKGLGTDKR